MLNESYKITDISILNKLDNYVKIHDLFICSLDNLNEQITKFIKSCYEDTIIDLMQFNQDFIYYFFETDELIRLNNLLFL